MSQHHHHLQPRSERSPLLPDGAGLALAAYGWLAACLALAGAAPHARAVVVYSFAAVCPGLALVRLLYIPVLLERLVLAVALSLSIDTLTATGMAVSGWWSPALCLAGLATLCTIAAFVPAWRTRRVHTPVTREEAHA